MYNPLSKGWISGTDGCAYNGALLAELKKLFPKFVFTCGIDMPTGRYCVFVHDKVDRAGLPSSGEIAKIETSGSSDKEFEVLCAKIALLHG